MRLSRAGEAQVDLGGTPFSDPAIFYR